MSSVGDCGLTKCGRGCEFRCRERAVSTYGSRLATPWLILRWMESWQTSLGQSTVSSPGSPGGAWAIRPLNCHPARGTAERAAGGVSAP